MRLINSTDIVYIAGVNIQRTLPYIQQKRLSQNDPELELAIKENRVFSRYVEAKNYSKQLIKRRNRHGT
jgi:hypothetical protein